jgi:hypothetical protein
VCWLRECHPLISEIEEERIAAGLPARPPLDPVEQAHLEDREREKRIRQDEINRVMDPRKPKAARYRKSMTIYNPIEGAPATEELRGDYTRPPRTQSFSTLRLARQIMTGTLLAAVAINMTMQYDSTDEENESDTSSENEDSVEPESDDGIHSTLGKRKKPESPPRGWG